MENIFKKKKDDKITIYRAPKQKYEVPKLFKDIIDFDKKMVSQNNEVLHNYRTVNIATMVDNYISYEIYKSSTNGSMAMDYVVDILLVFNFLVKKNKLLYTNEIKQDLLTKFQSDFKKMDLKFIHDTFIIMTHSKVHNTDLVWSNFMFAPKYLLRLLKDFPLYYSFMKKKFNINYRAFLLKYNDFFRYIVKNKATYFPEYIKNIPS